MARPIKFYIIVSRTRDYSGERVYSSTQPATHSTFLEAMNEAARLSKVEHNKVFYVMEATHEVAAAPIPVRVTPL